MEKTIQDKLRIRSSNTLHAFNPYTDSGHIIGLIWKYQPDPVYPDHCTKELGSVDMRTYQDRLLERLGQKHVVTERNVVSISSSYGGEYVDVKLTHRNKIPEIINTCLEIGLCIKLQTNLQTFYRPQDSPFSLEKSEHLSLIGMNKTFDKYPDLLESKAWLWGDVRLWITNEGKDFARKIRSKFPECIAEADSDNYLLPSELDNPLLDFPMAPIPLDNQGQNKRPMSYEIPIKPEEVKVERKEDIEGIKNDEKKEVENVLEHERENKRKADEEEDETLCIICMEHKRNVAFDCGHVLICTGCDPQITSCPICRKPIITRLRLYINTT